MAAETNLRPSCALVTGASYGIGRAVATALLRQDYSLVLCARSEENLSSVRKELLAERAHGTVISVPTDISVASSRDQLVSLISASFGYLTLVVHCASARPDPEADAKLATTSMDTIEELVRTNVAGTFYLVKQLQGLLKAGQPSQLVLISSDWALRGTHGPPIFSAAKAAIAHFAHAVRKEMANDGISVTTIYPGDVASFDKDWSAPKWGLDDSMVSVSAELGNSRISLLDVAETVLFVANRKLARVEEVILAPLDAQYDY